MTHRAVDEIAGLPQGSSTYYFPKKATLLIAAAQHLAQILEKDCDELQVGFAETAAKQGLDAAVAYVAKELVAYADNSRQLFLARMELTMASARREDLAGVGAELSAAARRPIEFFLKLISDGRADVPIETCAGLIRWNHLDVRDRAGAQADHRSDRGGLPLHPVAVRGSSDRVSGQRSAAMSPAF